jgi:hypothetical protein
MCVKYARVLEQTRTSTSNSEDDTWKFPFTLHAHPLLACEYTSHRCSRASGNQKEAQVHFYVWIVTKSPGLITIMITNFHIPYWLSQIIFRQSFQWHLEEVSRVYGHLSCWWKTFEQDFILSLVFSILTDIKFGVQHCAMQYRVIDFLIENVNHHSLYWTLKVIPCCPYIQV